MSGSTLNFVTFNQDHSCLAVGSSKGFRIYHTDPFSKIFNSDEGNVTIIEMLFSTSLVAIVRSPRHLVIQNTKVSRHPTPPFPCVNPADPVPVARFHHLRAHLPYRRARRAPE